jgi:hypothetical protein
MLQSQLRWLNKIYTSCYTRVPFRHCHIQLICSVAEIVVWLDSDTKDLGSTLSWILLDYYIITITWWDSNQRCSAGYWEHVLFINRLGWLVLHKCHPTCCASFIDNQSAFSYITFPLLTGCGFTQIPCKLLCSIQWFPLVPRPSNHISPCLYIRYA